MYQGTHEAHQSHRYRRWMRNNYSPEEGGRYDPPRHMVRAEPYTGKTLVDAKTYKAVNNTRLPHIGAKQRNKAMFQSLLKGPQS